MTAAIHLTHWRHREGGRVAQLWGDRFSLEITISRRRRNRYGVREPLTAHLYLYDPEPARRPPSAAPGRLAR